MIKIPKKTIASALPKNLRRSTFSPARDYLYPVLADLGKPRISARKPCLDGIGEDHFLFHRKWNQLIRGSSPAMHSVDDARRRLISTESASPELEICTYEE
jgi:hypothetical protein